jgi:polysaccharide export outer membrane protein
MRIVIVTLIGICFLASCTPQKRATYNYLEQIKDSSFRKSVYLAEPIIQKNDLLSIQVYSASTNPEVDKLYNLPVLNTGTQTNSQLQGYLVDENGKIELPRIGILFVEGLTKTQLADTIKSRLQGQLTQPSVIIRFLNFRVTVLGEVGSPQVLNITTERLNILEAVGMAGGVTEYGKIKEVKVLRENNNERQMGVLDLTSKDIFSSPYYQLQQNDIVLVDKTPYRLRLTEQQRVIQQVGFATGIITAIALILTFFK